MRISELLIFSIETVTDLFEFGMNCFGYNDSLMLKNCKLSQASIEKIKIMYENYSGSKHAVQTFQLCIIAINLDI